MDDNSAPADTPSTMAPKPGRIRLKRVSAASLSIIRRKAGRGFTYLDGGGRRITDEAVLARIRALAIPPAYRDVRIAALDNAHLQAVGRDEAGRIQHRYHAEWDRIRETRKAARLAVLVAALPRIRAAVARDLAARGAGRDTAAACGVALIDQSHMRVGGEAYARANGSRGAATLLKRHAEIGRGTVRLGFRGKSGKDIAVSIAEPRLARALKRLAALPGERLLQFEEAAGVHALSSADINAYLRRVAGAPVSAKDFRTLAGSSEAAEQLLQVEPANSEAARRRQLAAVMRHVSKRLANTPAVVRKSYVHASVVKGFLTGRLKKAWRLAKARRDRRRIEAAVGSLVQ